MQPEFWLERWQNGQVGFHQATVHSSLTRYGDVLAPRDALAPRDGLGPRDAHASRAGRVFVPLCGKSIDMLWLRDAGHEVVGVELSAIAAEAFCMENGLPARRRILADFDCYEAPGMALLRGDFFSLTRAILGPVSAVYDRAALVSFAPELRASYVAQLAALVTAGTRVLLVSMEYPMAQISGPPFSLPRAEVEQLCTRYFDVQELGREEILASEPRLRARGLTRLTEVCYRLTRR